VKNNFEALSLIKIGYILFESDYFPHAINFEALSLGSKNNQNLNILK
jgi:hypothetical protein